MAKRLGNRLPEVLCDLLRHHPPSQEGFQAVPVITLRDDGTPHLALVSPLISTHDGAVRFPLGVHTRSLRHIRSGRRLTVMFAALGRMFYLEGTGHVLGNELRSMPGEAVVELQIDGVHEDSANEMALHGITYRFFNEEASERHRQRLSAATAEMRETSLPSRKDPFRKEGGSFRRYEETNENEGTNGAAP